MIYQRQFLKELSLTAAGVFVLLLLVLVITQAINLLGRAASGSVAIEAVGALVGFWTLGLSPILLILTAYISILTVLTQYWRNSEMTVWMACGLPLRRWVKPILRFAVPFAVLVAVVVLWVKPWAELRSSEFAEMLKQQQELSMIETGVFREIGGSQPRVYFVEDFNSETGEAHRLFVRETDRNGRDVVVFAQKGRLIQDKGKRTLILQNGYRYSGKPGQADYDRASFQEMTLVMNATALVVDAKQNRRSAPTAQLWHSSQPQLRAELLWRLSQPISVVILGLLALPLSYYNPRGGQTYNILFAVLLFLVYQNGLTFLRNAVEDGKLPFLLGLLPMHVLMFLVFWLLLRWRSGPARPLRTVLKTQLSGRKEP